LRPTRIRDFEMENYDLSTITRDNLRFLLSTAKGEIVKFTRCREEVNRLNERIEEEKKKEKQLGRQSGCFTLAMIGGGIFIALLLFPVLFSRAETKIEWKQFFLLSAIFIIPILYIVFYKKAQKRAQSNVQKYKEQLPRLEKKEEEAMNEFKALLFIPNEYCYEYALTTMLQFINSKRADNWKEVTGLYEEHLHRMTMEDNSRQTLEQSKLQAEYARKGRDAARWAAAGTWATAAGVWRK